MDRGHTNRSAVSANPDVWGGFGFSPHDESVPYCLCVVVDAWLLGVWTSVSLGDGHVPVLHESLSFAWDDCPEAVPSRPVGLEPLPRVGRGPPLPCVPSTCSWLCERGPVSLCPAGVSPGLWLRRIPFLTCAEPSSAKYGGWRNSALPLRAALLSLVQLVASGSSSPLGPVGS